MEAPSQHSARSQKSFVIFLFVVILGLLGVVGYLWMYVQDLEDEIVTPEEAQAILAQLPDNPDADGLSPQDRAKLLEGLEPN
jgi:flagellar basal body-associated protein FliL